LLELHFKNTNLLVDQNVGVTYGHVSNAVVIHFTFKLQPPSLSHLVACVECKGLLSFLTAKWAFYYSLLVFSLFTQDFDVRVLYSCTNSAGSNSCSLPSPPQPEKGTVDRWSFIENSAKCVRVDPWYIAFLANAVSRTG
jgi:hypothetical protein